VQRAECTPHQLVTPARMDDWRDDEPGALIAPRTRDTPVDDAPRDSEYSGHSFSGRPHLDEKRGSVWNADSDQLVVVICE
jgi:hypothetical protein